MTVIGAIALLSCTKTTTTTEVVPEGTAAGAGSSAGTTAGGTAGGDTSTGSGTTAGATTGGATGVGTTGVGETTAGGTTGGEVGALCGIDDHPGKPLGAECSSHDECETGYCYDEYLWNEDGNIQFRFCTVGCTSCTVKGNCNEWTPAPGVESAKCIPFTSSFKNFYDLQLGSLCLNACTSDADCAGIPPFTRCAKPTFGKDYDYGVWKVCQPETFAKLPRDDF